VSASPPARAPLVARLLLSLMIRGPEAEFFRGDIEQEFARRREAGDSRAARRWYTRQVGGALLAWWRPGNGWIRRGGAPQARKQRGRTGTGMPSPFPPRLPGPTAGLPPRGTAGERSSAMLFDDIRHAWRRMMSRPGTIVLAAAMLGLGIGLTTAMFTLADSLLLRPVPFRDPDRLAHLMMMTDGSGSYAVSVPVFKAWRDSPAFDAVEAANDEPVLIETEAGPIERRGALVTPGLFEMLDVRPLRGRLFAPGEGQAGAGDVVLISEDLWRSVYGADPDVVGRRIDIDGKPRRIVGVLPAEFRFPEWNTLLWLPIDYDVPPPELATTTPIAFVRFSSDLPQIAFAWNAPDIPQPDALRVATDAARAADSRMREREMSARPRSLGGLQIDEYYERAIPLLSGGVALVFLVLCANVSGLLLVRFGARRREFGLCSALGASRARLLRQALGESVMLGVLGSAFGIALAFALVSAARTLLPEPFLLRTLNPLNLDARALLAACSFGVLSTLAAGLLPAWAGTRLSLSEALHSVEQGGTESRTSRALSRGLIVTEIALACALLVGASILVRSFINIVTADRGLQTEGVVTAWIVFRSDDFPDPAARASVRIAVESELRSLPGVRQMALSFGLPPDGGYFRSGDDWLSDVPGAAPMSLIVNSYDVGADFFELYGIPLLRGRTFQEGDSRYDIIVAERLAELLWPGLDPVGRSFTRGEEHFTVIGLVPETSFPSIDPSMDRPEFYSPVGSLEGQFTASLRCEGRCPTPASIRQHIMRLNPAVNVVDVGPLEAKYAEQFAQPRAAAALGATFAVIALLAAAGGLFSVLTAAVRRRRRELGVRTALGATSGDLRVLVMRDALMIALTGVVVGAGFAWMLARSLTTLQYGVTSSDPATWATVGAVLVVATLLASWWPARQATRADAVALLREE
jgi:putative ABC transport system permease protein